jgi:hypothetical protein
VTSLSSLDSLYESYEQLFTESNVVSLHAFDTDYGTVKLNSTGMSAFSEVMVKLLAYLGVSLTPEIASNLLAGMEVATDDFRSSSVSADTFEAVAQLMRAGGRRLPQAKVNKQASLTSSTTVASTPPTNGFAHAIEQKAKGRKQSIPVSEIPRMEGGARV